MSKHVWHPYSQMKTDKVLKVKSAKDSKITLEDGREIIDAVSSWWVNPHGHANEHVAKTIYDQALTLEHVIFSGFTHEPAERLAERVSKKYPGDLNRVFFSDNGSTAVEAAMKMAIQYHYNKGEQKTTLIAFENAYHGDTFGAMSSSQPDSFFNAFKPFHFKVERLPVPTEENKAEVLAKFKAIALKGEAAAFIFEPLLQAASGMILYPPHLLDMLISMAKQHGILCIADEVMTGFARTGKMFAMEYLEETADICCLSKCLTAGFLPMALTLATDEIYQAFLDDDRSKMFFHGHSYTGNPIGCAAAHASMDFFEKEDFMPKINWIGQQHRAFLDKIKKHPKVTKPRMFGTMLAFDWDTGEGATYFSSLRNTLYEFFLSQGVLLRPLGNVIYILPPYCITKEELEQVYTAIEKALDSIEG